MNHVYFQAEKRERERQCREDGSSHYKGFFFVFFRLYTRTHPHIHLWLIQYVMSATIVKLFYDCFLIQYVVIEYDDVDGATQQALHTQTRLYWFLFFVLCFVSSSSTAQQTKQTILKQILVAWQLNQARNKKNDIYFKTLILSLFELYAIPIKKWFAK